MGESTKKFVREQKSWIQTAILVLTIIASVFALTDRSIRSHDDSVKSHQDLRDAVKVALEITDGNQKLITDQYNKLLEKFETLKESL